MSYEFGTNWSVFSTKAGPVIGPLMAYEVLTAFFLEAGFLGVMLFGLTKVGPRLHFFATCMVALGTLVSATWIISVNSWMQTPAGYIVNAKGQFEPGESWLPIIFNPSFPYRLVHTVLASYLTTALAVGGVGGWHLLRDRFNPGARRMFAMAMGMIVVVAPLQIVAGDEHGLNTLAYQPAKVLAMEGDFEPSPNGAPLVLFGVPNRENNHLDYEIAIPHLGSMILKHDPFAALPGLNDFPPDKRPPVAIVFWSFRLMVSLGLAMLGLGVWGLWARFKGKLYDMPWLHRAAVAMGPAGFVAVIAGWVTTEVGRQPYTIFGLLLTADSRSPIAAPAVAASLAAFAVVYFFVFGAGVYYLLKLMGKAPERHESEPPSIPQRAGGVGAGPAISLVAGE
jgi:cytochrome d ubiquinol oxidase subunit I